MAADPRSVVWEDATKLRIFGVLAIAGFALAGLLGSAQSRAQNAYITNTSAGTVSVIDTATNTVTATIAVGGTDTGVAVSPDGSKVYIGSFDTNTVSVIATATNRVIATIAVPSPLGVAVSPDGGKVYVANFDASSVSVIATPTNTVIGSPIPVGAGSFPYGVAVSPDGSRVYVTNDTSNSVSVIAMATNKVSTINDLSFNGPTGVVVSPDGSKVYVANFDASSVSVIATATNAVTAVIALPVGSYPLGVAVTPDDSRVYVASCSGDCGSTVSVGTVSVIATATNMVTATIPVGLNPHGVAVTPDGSKVYIANSASGSVSVIATATNTVTDTVFGVPSAVAFGIFIQPAPLFIVSPDEVATTASGLAYSRVSRTFNGTVTITNIGSSAINGPLQILFTGLPAGVTLANATGEFSGSPYLTITVAGVAPGGGGSLAPGQSATASVQFDDPLFAAIKFTPVLYSGNI
jgi:YVTN family beta-propeller protein